MNAINWNFIIGWLTQHYTMETKQPTKLLIMLGTIKIKQSTNSLMTSHVVAKWTILGVGKVTLEM